jgi:hypothetical protein
MTAHAIHLVGAQAGVEDGLAYALAVGQLHQLLRVPVLPFPQSADAALSALGAIEVRTNVNK